jgi:hypothetical protein
VSGTTPRRPAYRAELRAVARRLHPDLGGDVHAYLAAVAEVDRAHQDTGTVGGRRRPTWLLRRRLRRAVRAARSRLPRRLPGARRYARL